MSVTVPNARLSIISYTRHEDGSEIHAEIPTAFRVAMKLMLDRCRQKKGGYCKLSIDVPFKPRSYGPKKQKPDDPGYQANHLNGHLSQLAIHFGYTKQEMKEIMKDDVPEWPMEKRRIGKRVKLRPVSEADVSMEVESKAIEWTHMIAMEEEIELKEE
jgi:hypothetical protein